MNFFNRILKDMVNKNYKPASPEAIDRIINEHCEKMYNRSPKKHHLHLVYIQMN